MKLIFLRWFVVISLIGVLFLCIFQYFEIVNLKKKILNTDNLVHVISLDSLKRQIVNSGNVNCYGRLKFEYMDSDDAESLLPWALIMANKFNYKLAYFDVYASIQAIDMYFGQKGSKQNSLKLSDTASRRIALEYLKCAAKNHNEQAQAILLENSFE